MADQGVQDKVTIITGGGSGIGRATALAFAREGAKVVIAGRTLSKLESVAKEIQAFGKHPALVAQGDVGHEQPVKDMVKKTVDAYGRVDILVNNAGDEAFGFVKDMTEEKWDSRERVNLRSYFLCSKWVLHLGGMMERKEGLIVNTASTNVRGMSYPGWSAHVAFKYGALGFTDSLRKELAPYNIKVTLLCPGQVRTPLAQSPFVWGEVKRVHPDPRYIEPEDVAELTLFIAKQPARACVGEAHVYGTGRTN
ncbi:MAG: SDR family oxidoreductase [Chloroflexi bacterium]|nr:SDR family oxidoreductase [Chloroflexota bacterium]